MKYIIHTILLMSILVMISCSSKPHDGVIPEPAEELISVSKSYFEAEGMAIGKMQLVALPELIATRGYIDVPPENKATISVFHGGYVQEINWLPGEQVKKGEKLFTLKDPDYIQMQQDYLEDLRSLEFLEQEYIRQKTLFDENITSNKKYLQAKSAFEVRKAHKEGLEEQLRLLNIPPGRVANGEFIKAVPVFAPINGFISEININRGTYLDPKDAAMEIINPEHMHLELKVFEKDVVLIRDGQKIYFSVPESGKEEMEGIVHVTGRSISGSERTVDVHGHLIDPTDKLTIGMYVEANIAVDTDSAFCVPPGAISSMDGIYYLLVKESESEDSYQFSQRMVKTGKKTDSWVEILDENLLEKNVLLTRSFNLISE